MNKKLFIYLLLFTNFIYSQTYSTAITGASTSPSGRAPQGSMRYIRNVWLITAAEMSAAGYTTGSIFNGLGFNYSAAQSISTSGEFIVYMQNTTDATNIKSNDWATSISSMEIVSNSTVTIPSITGTFDTTFVGGTSFTYTGGALYIAFEYHNSTGTLSTANTAMCNSTLSGGLRGVTSPVDVAPTTLASSSFRPETRIGVQNLGITDFEESKLTLSPNPTSNFLTVHCKNEIINNITITSIDGRKAFSQENIQDNQYELNISNYQAGLYLVTIETLNGAIIRKKIIKK